MKNAEMTPERLATLLSAGPLGEPRPSPTCPDENAVAGYVDGTLGPGEAREMDAHLADCDGCIALVGRLCRERKGELSHRRPAGRSWRFAAPWAAAAALALVVPLLLTVSRDLDRNGPGSTDPSSSSTRASGPVHAGLTVVSPGAGEMIDPGRPQFSWTEVRGTPFYDVSVVTDSGDVLIRQRVPGTTWQLPAGVALQAGGEYFVLVTAYPSGEKSVSSRHVPFRVPD